MHLHSRALTTALIALSIAFLAAGRPTTTLAQTAAPKLDDVRNAC
jgi:hypothetical protein